MAVEIPLSAARVVSEPTRERETYKYDHSLLKTIRYNDSGAPIPSPELVTSSDTVLTALAQLGACRTNTARSLISLFDQKYQYIVAEATPTIPLVPSVKHEDRNEDLWLCGTAIPRFHGVCEHTLASNELAMFEENEGSTKLPLVLVSDLTSDPNFSTKPYCQPGAPAQFYAAVPIRTHRGINIGVYCVIDTLPRDLSTWDENSTELLRNISRSIMLHLEYRRSSSVHARDGRMMRAVGSFVEGKKSLSGDDLERDLPDAEEKNGTVPGVKEKTEVAVMNKIDVPGPGSTRRVPDREPSYTTSILTGERSHSPSRIDSTAGLSDSRDFHEDAKLYPKIGSYPARRHTVQDVFTRAANIVREALEVDGCLVLDASVGPFGALSGPHPDSDEDTNTTHSPSASAASGEDGKTDASETDLPCRILGSSSSHHEKDALLNRMGQLTSVPQNFLSRLLRRYPRGKMFNFDEIGDIQSTDSSGEESGTPKAPRSPRQGTESPENEPVRRQRSPWSRRAEGATIRRIFPGARSIAFVPIWDPKKERWFAGGFAYTHASTYILTTEAELNYLRAFGMLMMEESFRVETALADKAKSDVLNSLSHELRSPLHGILAANELLNDTDLDAFQSNIVHTLETCSRTLLDTVEHLLTFSKVNRYVGRMKRRRNTARVSAVPQGRVRTETALKGLHAHVRLDILVDEVVESVFAGFNFQHASLSQVAKQKSSTRLADIEANRRLDSMRALEELRPGQLKNGELQLDLGNVSVFLDIDASCPWVFHTQPGAIRRIVMNLFGNSLKYTPQGSIVISLSQDKVRRRDRLRMVKIVVSDSGKGISDDYLRHDLFRPFSQEDPLAVGTGLGLSLVKQIVTHLKGSINVDSRVGVGTTISVSIPLHVGNPDAVAMAPSGDDKDFVQAISELEGLRLQLIGFNSSEWKGTNDADHTSLGDISASHLTETICRNWLKMDILSNSKEHDSAPDLVLYTEDALDRAWPRGSEMYPAPGVVICANTLASFQRSASAESNEMMGVLEYISQPTAPRKLAKAMSLAWKRWKVYQAQAPEPEKMEESVPNSPLSLHGIIMPSILRPEGPGEPNSSSDKTSDSLSYTTSNTSNGSIMGTPKSPPLITSPVPDVKTPPTEVQSLESPAFLLVDDNPINVKVLSSYMKKIGHNYSAATNGLEAVEAFCQNPGSYKCVFMDISMPVMDGFEATRQIRAFEREKALVPVPIFALSGLASASTQQEAAESGIDLFLTKPVKLKALGEVLEGRGLL